MYLTEPQRLIRGDFSITASALDRRLTLRLDRDSNKCLELGYAEALRLDLPFKDRASFLRFLLHDYYQRAINGDAPAKLPPPVNFRGDHEAH